MKPRLKTLQIVAVGLVPLAFALTQPVTAQDAPGKQQSQAATEKTLTGVISDSMCGATHMAKDNSAAECTRLCVQQGQKYALVVGEKVYTLQGHEGELDKLAGQKATVKGTLSGETLTVASVAPTGKRGT